MRGNAFMMHIGFLVVNNGFLMVINRMLFSISRSQRHFRYTKSKVQAFMGINTQRLQCETIGWTEAKKLATGTGCKADA